MRVLMICPELPRDARPGSMAPTARQIQSLRDEGLEIDVVDMAGIPKLKYALAIPRIRKLARRADLIHAHFGYCGWLGAIGQVAASHRKPIVMSFMGDDLLGSPYNEAGDLEWFSRVMVRANKRLAKQVTRVIVKSQGMADVISPTPSVIIANGIDIDVFQPLAREIACERLDFDPHGLRVLFPGNPDNPNKGFAFAKQVVEVASQRLSRHIDLTPLWNIEPSQVSLYMNACHVMVMVSLSEGSPNVVKEALACNVPVLGVPVGDVHDQLQGVEGCVACSREVSVFAEHLAALLVQNTRSRGRDAIVSRGLDLQSVARRVIGVYEEALGTIGGSSSPPIAHRHAG